MTITGQVSTRPRQERFYEILATVKRAQRAFATRACMRCGERFMPNTHGLHIDPCCDRCTPHPRDPIADFDLSCGD